jgi:hypothetical protein
MEIPNAMLAKTFHRNAALQIDAGSSDDLAPSGIWRSLRRDAISDLLVMRISISSLHAERAATLRVGSDHCQRNV